MQEITKDYNSLGHLKIPVSNPFQSTYFFALQFKRSIHSQSLLEFMWPFLFCVLYAQVKCLKYWPSSDPEVYGSIIVTPTEEDELADYTIRKFTIQMVSVHFFFHGNIFESFFIDT